MPENVTLEWIGRTLLDMRQEASEFREETRQDILSLREQFTRLEAAQIRLENGVREAIRHLRAEATS